MLNNNTINFPFSDQSMQQVIAYDANNRPQYVGQAHPGVTAALPQWQIRKITYTEGGLIESIKFAAGKNDYLAIWNDRATYDYA